MTACYSFPAAAEIHDHTLGGCQRHSSRGQKSGLGLPGLQPTCWRHCVPSESSREEPVFSPFPGVRGLSNSLAGAPLPLGCGKRWGPRLCRPQIGRREATQSGGHTLPLRVHVHLGRRPARAGCFIMFAGCMEKELFRNLRRHRQECAGSGQAWTRRGPLESSVVQRRARSCLAKVVSVDGFEGKLGASRTDLEDDQM